MTSHLSVAIFVYADMWIMDKDRVLKCADEVSLLVN